MGQWYSAEHYNTYYKTYNKSWIYTFDRKEKRNNTIYIQSDSAKDILYFTRWENVEEQTKFIKKLPWTDFRQGIVYIIFSDYKYKEELVNEMYGEGDLVSYLEIV